MTPSPESLREAVRLLPCIPPRGLPCPFGERGHWDNCPAHYRPAVALALDKARREEAEECALICDAHAKFCDDEARAGGQPSLFERARGVAYMAVRIRARHGGGT